MESGDLYSLSNSTADDSSNKSDSSTGQNFDPHVCYQDYDIPNDQLNFSGFRKCSNDDDINEKLKKSQRDGIKAVTADEYGTKKNAPMIPMTSASLNDTSVCGAASIENSMRVGLNDNNPNGSSASVSSAINQQTVNSKTKSKGLFNIFSTSSDVEASYHKTPDISMKVVHPMSSAFYKNKRTANQQFRDEFMLSLSRTELRQSSNSLSQMNVADKSTKDHDQQLFEGFPMSSRLGKEVTLSKTYPNLQMEEVDKSESMSLSSDHARDVPHADKISSLDRLRGNSLLVESSGFVDRSDLRNLHGQSTSRTQNHFDQLNFERMKQNPYIAKDPVNDNPSSLRSSLTRDAFMTHLQQTHTQQQQQHQQQQTKSFTIDAILGLRNNQRDKHRGQQFRKHHQGQDETGPKHASSNSCSSGGGGGGGKLKRVRTIFTAEQLERLEGEFARQQYMVGPERLYLAHALRLTEAQVKVWFQNRRIKWRKLNHEQQSQRLHELHQRSISSLEHEDSNETGEW